MKISELFPEVLLEDRSYEFKARLSPDNPLRWAKTFVAFSNGDGGCIFIGVSDDREAFGLTIKEIDETKNLVALVNDRHIFPHIKYAFSLRSVDEQAERFVLAINVSPSDSIVSYREGDFNELVYVKGDGNATPARPNEIIALSKRKYGVDSSLTETPYTESEWRYFGELCEEYREDHQIPSIKELQNKDAVSKDGNATSGFLMFKDDYEGDDTRIHCRLFRGLDKAAPVLDRAEYKGSIAKTLQQALIFVDRNTKHGYYKQGMRRIDTDAYPKDAVREAIVNAIAHRDYSIMGTQIDVNIFDDRIEITSPGSWILPKEFSEYSLSEIPSIRRNQVICACFDIAKLMERGGTGFQTIFNAYKGKGQGKQPSVTSYPGFFVLKLFDLLYENGKATENGETPIYISQDQVQSIVINELSKGPRTVQKLQDLTSYKSRSKFNSFVIAPLLEEGKIERVGNPHSPKAYFILKK